jgi:hypothetical protein
LVLMGILTLVLREAVYLPQRPSPWTPPIPMYCVGFWNGDATRLLREQRILWLPTPISRVGTLPQAILTDTTTNCSVVINADTTIKIIGFKMGFVSNKTHYVTRAVFHLPIPPIRLVP